MAGVLLRPKWAGARRDEGAYPQRSVTEEQRSPSPFSAQPFGPQFFWPPASLLVPYRPARVCSSLAPSGRPKSLAAKHQLFVRHITRVCPRNLPGKPLSATFVVNLSKAQAFDRSGSTKFATSS